MVGLKEWFNDQLNCDIEFEMLQDIQVIIQKSIHIFSS